MKKLSLIMATTFLFSPAVFSGEAKNACKEIAKACEAAGFKDNDKKFWRDCMRPVILGKKVDGVTVESTQVTTCRERKIVQLQRELKEFQSVK
ncbi:Uncharacterised protein [Legionella beliardensis]|uniref:Uncharacterized protein n=1 Tax=Legionella beliardensis TaxID=91822 RepID=A0A378HZ75_9GAMM|nr:hypothetical protein [Legionella beliardensis]STX27675.1 Uncharacterised protein [Legionella beliardensis]